MEFQSEYSSLVNFIGFEVNSGSGQPRGREQAAYVNNVSSAKEKGFVSQKDRQRKGSAA